MISSSPRSLLPERPSSPAPSALHQSQPSSVVQDWPRPPTWVLQPGDGHWGRRRKERQGCGRERGFFCFKGEGAIKQQGEASGEQRQTASSSPFSSDEPSLHSIWPPPPSLHPSSPHPPSSPHIPGQGGGPQALSGAAQRVQRQ